MARIPQPGRPHQHMSEEPDNTQKVNDPRDARTDSTGEFFCVGSPLHAVKAGYIQRRADDLLYEAVIAGRYAHVIAPDRSGKSSLIAATAARLESKGFRVAVLDLNQIGERDAGQDPGRWYYSVAYRLLRQLRIRFDLQSWWQDKSILNNRQRLHEFYLEVLLENLPERIVIFVDESQCISALPSGDQLLASIRSAHNARATEPELNRLTFVLLAECDPLMLINEPEASPFSITQAVPLDDFSRASLDLFVTELDLGEADAELALDRIYYWTRGQPYLTQKLARAVARDVSPGDIAAQVDRIVAHQLTGRAALHSEPHIGHIHRQLVAKGKQRERLLNLYGRIRKGIAVAADLGSDVQRRLLAVGLLEVDDAGELRVRNRVYESVFTSRWANENLRIDWKAPLLVAAAILLIVALPLVYTQWLPVPYARVLTAADSELPAAETAWQNLRSFPGHTTAADSLYRVYLENAAANASDVDEIDEIARLAAALPEAGLLPQQMQASFWDRRERAASRAERRDTALIASLESLVHSTPMRRNTAASLVGDDYPQLLATVTPIGHDRMVLDPRSRVFSVSSGAHISQWTLEDSVLERRDDWLMTALEVTPLVRRVVVDQGGTASRIGLTLNVSHPRLADLRMRLTAPSGRSVEIRPNRERASSSDDLRIDREQLQPLVGESLAGTWSLSLRDEATGVAGHLVGWNLNLNSQGLEEGFQRGISIPDPIERETERFWLGDDGRYAVARAANSDSVRIWDLGFGQPIATVAVAANEKLIGLDAGARQLVTATLETINLWDIASGKKSSSLPVGIASRSATLTEDRRHLFVQQLGDNESWFELWDLETGTRKADLTLAGATGLVALDSSGARIAVADYDQSVRVWDFATRELLTQIDLPMQPGSIRLNAGGEVLAAVFGTSGLSVWNVVAAETPLLESYGDGDWQFRFSPSGSRFAAGHPRIGFTVYNARDGRWLGPAMSPGSDDAVQPGDRMLQFGFDENVLVTNGPDAGVRFWQLPEASVAALESDDGHSIWATSGDAVVSVLPNGSAIAIADRAGHVHFEAVNQPLPASSSDRDDISFLGHSRAVRAMSASRDSSLLASVGDDNTIRVWDTAEGLPRSYIASFPGVPIEKVAFSPDAALLAMLAGSRAVLVDTDDGAVLADIELGERHAGLAFVGETTLYVGDDSGALSVITRNAAGGWDMQHVWQGPAAIRQLAASPRGNFLVLVDDEQRAVLFNVAEGRPGSMTLELPTPVEEVVFSRSGSRVLFRTARWVHRAGSSMSGLAWLDARFVPNALNGSGIVFGGPANRSSSEGNEFYLPVIQDGAPHLQQFAFSDPSGTGLFGSRNELLDSWRERLFGIGRQDSFLD